MLPSFDELMESCRREKARGREAMSMEVDFRLPPIALECSYGTRSASPSSSGTPSLTSTSSPSVESDSSSAHTPSSVGSPSTLELAPSTNSVITTTGTHLNPESPALAASEPTRTPSPVNPSSLHAQAHIRSNPSLSESVSSLSSLASSSSSSDLDPSPSSAVEPAPRCSQTGNSPRRPAGHVPRLVHLSTEPSNEGITSPAPAAPAAEPRRSTRLQGKRKLDNSASSSSSSPASSSAKPTNSTPSKRRKTDTQTENEAPSNSTPAPARARALSGAQHVQRANVQVSGDMSASVLETLPPRLRRAHGHSHRATRGLKPLRSPERAFVQGMASSKAKATVRQNQRQLESGRGPQDAGGKGPADAVQYNGKTTPVRDLLPRMTVMGMLIPMFAN